MKISEHNSHLVSTGKIEPGSGVYKKTTGAAKARANWSVILHHMPQAPNWFGLKIDPARNIGMSDMDGRITADDSRIHAYALPRQTPG
jgi:hypothetical protein